MRKKSILKATTVILVTAALGTVMGQGLAAMIAKRTKAPAPGTSRNPIVKRFRFDPRMHVLVAAKSRMAYLNTYRGTELAPSPDADAEDIAFYGQIARAFAREDPMPPVRSLKYRWIEQAVPGVKLLGWRGIINEVRPDGAGSLTVRITIYPQIAHEDHTVLSTNDPLIETYRFTPGRGLEFLQAQEDPSGVFKAIFSD